VEQVLEAIEVLGLSAADRRVLDRRYGSRVSEVLSIMSADPTTAAPLADAAGYLRAEVAHACLNEGACRLDDVLDRRLRVGLNLDAVTPALVESAAAVMGAALGWDAARIRSAVTTYADGTWARP
jgi:glycerol-3-phosphate dehydrogenase